MQGLAGRRGCWWVWRYEVGGPEHLIRDDLWKISEGLMCFRREGRICVQCRYWREGSVAQSCPLMGGSLQKQRCLPVSTRRPGCLPVLSLFPSLLSMNSLA